MSDDMVSVETTTHVRTSRGVIPRGSTAGLPRKEAERLQDEGSLRILEDEEASSDAESSEVPEDYNDLKSRASELADRTGIKPSDYKKTTLTEYVKKHGGQ